MTEQPVVTLPASGENLIDRICEEQNQPPLDHLPRQHLALIGEQRALELLNVFSKSKIRSSFNAYIVHMMNNSSSSYVSPPKPSPSSSEASISSFPLHPPKPFPPSSSESSMSPSPSPFPLHPPPYCVLTALGELEFRKSFLLLSYVGE
ncbi:hypothetical protein TSUD_142470 [Trifolium subterraneum]|uniref:RDRP3-5 N-terminal domain-containing protein n=1 Tax=Trifolium subterraneum TaxID=3900 RepID=A0A2Z6N0Z1_TRISU|nr:hypothetical protein TSUD_142470 [Trifolium subterraneum]